ncbi:MAG: ATP-binding protein [Solibacillus sp.]
MEYLLEELRSRNDDEISRKLYILADKICKEATDHLKLIINQLPEFDIHDESHSKKIIENIELLIGKETISNLSSYELFLIYMSGFLHDCAMALPEWELKLLTMSEGKEGFTNNTIRNPIPHDGKRPYKMSEALAIINENKEYLYIDFEKTKEFIFSFKNEEQFIRDLANRLIEYQEFRNGYALELKNYEENNDLQGYLEFSDLLRYDFVRITHAQRIEAYIQNLSSKFIDTLGGAWGEALAKDLGKVCRSHGESMDYVKRLPLQANYYGSQTANLQFVSVMLRLGDILHFSHDRAPRSLFVEKMITSKVSLLHWKVKFQGINYSLNEIDENGRKQIKYMAYCDEPSLYYFIQDYLDWIDMEISNYFDFFNGMKYFSRMSDFADKYHLNISESVDRTQIRYNESKFTPVSNMKFTLNQMKILELLMGVGLYKNKFLCLRELYQNALDASRCMISIMKDQKIEIQGNIEFGIKEITENNIKRRYIYCKDNGIGMTKDIIKNYFLNIGNSFYKSREFHKLKSTWKDDFQPTSQFGIGILSCFMIGNKIEVTTLPLRNSGSEKSVSFSIDGPHEHFYFKNPDELDLEEIGPHGTLIKVFLDTGIEINNFELKENLDILIKGSDKDAYKNEYPDIIKIWNTNIFNYIHSFVGIPDKNVDVQVRFANNEIAALDKWNRQLHFKNLNTEKVRLIYSDYRYMSDGYNPIEDYLKAMDGIKLELVSVNSKDIEYSFLLSLPLPNLEILDWRILNFEECLYKEAAVLIDGIYINNAGLDFDLDYKRDLMRNGIVNFIGTNRPNISVDRNNITSLNEQLTKQFEEIAKLVSKTILEKVKCHLKTYENLLTEKQKLLIWDYIFGKYKSLTSVFIQSAIDDNINMPLLDLNLFLEGNPNVPEFIASKEICFDNLDMRFLNKTEKIVTIGKMINANNIKVSKEKVTVNSDSFNIFDSDRDFIEEYMLPLVIKADEWDLEFIEYDIISKVWPIIPERLYNIIQGFEIKDIIRDRSKTVSTSGNSLAGLVSTDPVLVHPIMGFFSKREDTYWKKSNWVGKFQHRKGGFWLFELNNHGDLVRQKKEDVALIAFISPRDLSEEELLLLEDFIEDTDYYSGVKKGWSVLILGKTAEMVIKPGIWSRDELVKLVKPSFWKHNNEIIYKFTDGTLLNR